MTVGSNLLQFSYDAAGTPMAVLYNGTTYYYVTNIQGDVIAILNDAGTAVVEYAYDAWGNLLATTGTMATTLGETNPLRYRGYVYDSEYEFYYLQSRYYNPEVGRFLNADAFASTGQGLLGNNMFAYCQNDPIMFIDPDGLCREVGALLTWIDCGDPDCPTSSLNDPERYTSGYNNPKYVDNQRYYEEQAKLLEPIFIPIPEPVEVALGGFVVGFVPGTLGGMPGAVGSGGASVLIAGVGAGLLGAIGALIDYLIFG